MKYGVIDIKKIEKNDFILSPEFYLTILPKLEEEFIFKNALRGDTDRIKLDLDNLDLKTKLFIYDLLNARERLNKIRKIERGGI